MRKILLVPLVVWLFAATLAVGPPASAQVSSIESELLSLVNSSRSASLAHHSGLRSAARSHSKTMADRGGLTHSGAASRIGNAAPDPPESNGAPDDGYTGAWCENTGYVSGAPTSEIASRIHRGWMNSASHRACIADADMTATGIGLHFDGETWWATMESTQDNTPPGSGQPAPETPDPPTQAPTAPPTTAPTAAPTAAPPTAQPAAATPAIQPRTPRPTRTPASTPRPQARRTAPPPSLEAVAPVASANDPPGGFGLPETAAALGIGTALMSAVFWLRRRRA